MKAKLKPFKEEDYVIGNEDLVVSDYCEENTKYFTPFERQVKAWKKKHDMATISLEFRDLLNTIYRKGLRERDNKRKGDE